MSRTANKTILLMAGGTGGHIFPALAVGKELQQQGWKLHWLGSEGGMEEELVPKHGIKMTLLPVKGVRNKGLASLIKAPFQLLKSVLLSKIKPLLSKIMTFRFSIVQIWTISLLAEVLVCYKGIL